MKLFVTNICFTIVFMILLSSCETAVPKDPEGTVVFNVTSGYDLIPIKCIDPNPKICPYNNDEYPFLQFHFGMQTNSLNLSFTLASCLSDGAQCHYSWGNAVEIANIGPVGGLGAIKDKPTTGYHFVSSAQKGHGYVIRYRKTHNQSDVSQPLMYSRFYLQDWVTSATTGGIIGATVRFQGPF